MTCPYPVFIVAFSSAMVLYLIEVVCVFPIICRWAYGITLWELFSFGKQPYPTIPSMQGVVQFLEAEHR